MPLRNARYQAGGEEGGNCPKVQLNSQFDQGKTKYSGPLFSLLLSRVKLSQDASVLRQTIAVILAPSSHNYLGTLFSATAQSLLNERMYLLMENYNEEYSTYQT